MSHTAAATVQHVVAQPAHGGPDRRAAQTFVQSPSARTHVLEKKSRCLFRAPNVCSVCFTQIFSYLTFMKECVCAYKSVRGQTERI